MVGSGSPKWDVLYTKRVAEWLDELEAKDTRSFQLITSAAQVLERVGPSLGRPLVDSIAESNLKNLKELRPGSSGRTEIRILFIFDPCRQAVLLVAGDKSGSWSRWYRDAIKIAEEEYDEWVRAERQRREEQEQ